MNSNEIRKSFLDYFAGYGHRIVASSPLIPHDDPTLLFINAGMNQFKNVFTGMETRDYKTAVSSQKCLRAGGKHNDLENVGFTARHHTFFEMLGNFSFGDYFKEEAIKYAWEYVTKTIGLDTSKLYATVYNDDEQAEKLWKKIAPELKDRILRFGEKDNFWSMGDTGPCGPCSEIHYDRGDEYDGELNGDGDRFMEIWNLVFMQYNRDESGTMTPLPKPSVDTGAGLERFCMVLQDADSNYDTDLFRGLIETISNISGKQYSIKSDGSSHRVISDHVRALTFAIADGGIISNEGRGYVLRRILRRAARHGRLLDLHEPFIYKLVNPLVKLMGSQYPEIKSKQKHIELVIKSEEEQFGRTLDTGLEIFEDVISKLDSKGLKTIPGVDVFKLYDTYGFPVDLTEVMARERGLNVDMAGFDAELSKQKERSKNFKFGESELVELFDFKTIIAGELPEFDKQFKGYNKTKLNTTLINWDSVENYEGIILSETPFYPKSGGQVGDEGLIYNNEFILRVLDTFKYKNNIVHLSKLSKGVQPETRPLFVTAQVDHDRRADIKRNHTATHLLHRALRDVLGEHVHQSGSLVAPDRLRFDFTHFKAMTTDEIDNVEKIVNEKIADGLNVEWFEKSFDDAKQMGAVALFGEKYGDKVRVVKAGDYTMELCGGTHVDNTSDIGEFIIIQESAIAAGIRRIEAYTGRGAEGFMDEQNTIIKRIESAINKGAEKLSDIDIAKLKEDITLSQNRILARKGIDRKIDDLLKNVDKFQKEKEKSIAIEVSKTAGGLTPELDTDGGKLVVFIVSAQDAKELLIYSDRFKEIYSKSTVVTISSEFGGLAINSPDYGYALSVMNILKDRAGAKGGGKPMIRGSIPVAEISKAVKILREKH